MYDMSLIQHTKAILPFSHSSSPSPSHVTLVLGGLCLYLTGLCCNSTAAENTFIIWIDDASKSLSLQGKLGEKDVNNEKHFKKVIHTCTILSSATPFERGRSWRNGGQTWSGKASREKGEKGKCLEGQGRFWNLFLQSIFIDLYLNKSLSIDLYIYWSLSLWKNSLSIFIDLYLYLYQSLSLSIFIFINLYLYQYSS